MKTVYLAGPITGLNYKGAVDWRQHAITDLKKAGIKGLSPMRGKDYLLDAGTLTATGYDDKVLSSAKGITTRDRFDCQRCDVMLLNLLGATRVSIGSMIEIGWADSVGTPIVLAIEEGNPHIHAMVNHICGFVVPSLEEALTTVKIILG